MCDGGYWNEEATRLTAALAAAERRAEGAERRLNAYAGEVNANRTARADLQAAESRAASLSARVEALEGALNAARRTARPVIADDGVRASVAAGAWSALCALATPAASPTPTEDRHDD